MKKIFLSAALALAAASAAAAAPLDAFKGMSGTMDIAGGTAHIPVMKEAAKRIMGVNPEIRITVAGGGSGVGVKQAGEGLVAIGNTGRPLKEKEIAQYGLKTFPFAIDGVAVVVNPANPVGALTKEQVAAIYAGTVKDWSEVGGTAGAINVFGREDGSGTREVFTDKVINKGELAPGVNVVNSNGAMKTAVGGDERAIGYVGIGHIDASVKAPTLDGMTATQENAADGSYTVVRDLFMNTKGEPEGLTKAFIDYIYTDEGAEIIRKSGYIPLPRK
ncbi:phosphate ABC transporter substrate-binding protein [Pyramidobacter sp. C12-8]|uniref:phosphate ABC transporter substrate-binding protein n=1 Tax=Pyramidobacter sp. C12-8 TaxID=1943580 RepID=UPI00098F851C|nr:phosphate ABC transporter substrate-binding protein [Pyramidobacter sp. C12-8]OON89495.1 phosphate-binding protein [Pyramidobacter sp. C12-8]